MESPKAIQIWSRENPLMKIGRVETVLPSPLSHLVGFVRLHEGRGLPEVRPDDVDRGKNTICHHQILVALRNTQLSDESEPSLRIVSRVHVVNLLYILTIPPLVQQTPPAKRTPVCTRSKIQKIMHELNQTRAAHEDTHKPGIPRENRLTIFNQTPFQEPYL